MVKEDSSIIADVGLLMIRPVQHLRMCRRVMIPSIVWDQCNVIVPVFGVSQIGSSLCDLVAQAAYH